MTIKDINLTITNIINKYKNIKSCYIHNHDREYCNMHIKLHKLQTIYIYKNDILLKYTPSELLNKYSDYSQIIIDFGLLGDPNISKNLTIEEINKYIENIYNSLIDSGIYFLKVNSSYFEMSEYKLDFEKMIYPYFNLITFDIFKENKKKDNHKLFFLEKRYEINNLVIVAHPDDETIWCDEKLNKNTHVLVVFGLSKLGLKTAKIRKNEFINVMTIVGCSYEIWDYPEKKLRISNNVINEITLKIKNLIDKHKNVMTVYTHNEFGEYGHMDHLRINLIMKSLFIEYYKDKLFLKFYQFYPFLNYKNDDRFYNIPFRKASEKRKKLLDCYKSQTTDIYENIVTLFIDLNSNIL